MALFSLVQTPSDFAPCYKPVLWGFDSQRSPTNTVTGESGIAVVSIAAATATDVATYGSPLKVGDMMVIHGTIAGGILKKGQAVLLSGGTVGKYAGIHHVLKIITTNITVIDALDLGADTGGLIGKFYENYHIVVRVQMENETTYVTRTLSADGDGIFYLDVRDRAQATFKDVFEVTLAGTTTPVTGMAGYITQRYTIFAYEAFMIPNAQGVNIYTSPKKFIAGTTINGDSRVVNAVQPYHHIDESTDLPDLLWENDLTQYQMAYNVTDPPMRFLTYAPRGNNQTTLAFIPGEAQLIGEDEDIYLAFLNANPGGVGPSQDFTLLISNRTAAGAPIGPAIELTFTPPTDSGMLAVGTRNLAAYIDPAAHHYTVVLTNDDSFFISEVFSFEIDRKCGQQERRFFWRNTFGGVDAYTAKSREAVEETAKRFTLEKEHMKISFTPGAGGDWQQRTYRVDALRKRKISTLTMNRQMLRWVGSELMRSPDIRCAIYLRGDDYIWTRINMGTESLPLGVRQGRLELEYAFGIDNQTVRA